ncbi:MAG: DUF6542 domain-containing protein [Rhodococcus sp. (in: high G+C Gram-positive bacteria)]
MSTSQRTRSGVPLDRRSAVPSVPGVPAWGAVTIAVGACLLGFAVDSLRAGELSSTFAVMYVLGSLIAVVAVRHRGLFTAMVQPPIIMFVGVPLAYQLTTDGAGTSIKDIVLTVAVPLVDRFPLMFLTTLLVLGIGGVRLALDRRPSPVSTSRARSKSGSRSRSASSPAAPNREPAPTRRPERPRTTRAPRTTAESNGRTEQTPAAPSRTRAERRGRVEKTTRHSERKRTEPRESLGEPRHDRSRRDRPTSSAPREPVLREQHTRMHGPSTRAYEGHVSASDTGRSADYQPRRTGGENVSPYPAPRVRYRDRD